MSEIKQTIINEISTRNTITTQTDLNNYFNILTSLIEDINDGKVTFMKKRDDVLRRIYNTYLLLRDNTDDSILDESNSTAGILSSCVPTNTIDIVFDNTDMSNIHYPKFKWAPSDIGTGTEYHLIETGLIPKNYYICPFGIYIYKSNPINYVKYIYERTDNTVQLIQSPTSEFSDSLTLIPLTARLYRGSEKITGDDSDPYVLTLKFTSNRAIGELVSSDDE